MDTAPHRRTRRRRDVAGLLTPAERPPAASPVKLAAATVQLVRPAGVGYALREFSHAALIRLIDFPEMPLRTSADETVKAGQTALIVKTAFPVGDENVAAAWKRVRRPGWKRLLDVFRVNRCLRNFRLGLELRTRGIPTARPLAAIVPHRFDVRCDSYLATEWLDDAHNLHAFLKSLEESSDGDRQWLLVRAARSVGDLLGRLHAAGVSHRDLKPGNLLVREDSGLIEAFVIDLDGAAIRPALLRRTRVRNLARLARGLRSYRRLSRTHLLRGLHAYLDAADLNADPRRLWRDVARRSGIPK